MNKIELINLLQQKITQLSTDENRRKIKLSLPNFSYAVFSENFQSFIFYEQEMHKTLQQIEQAKETDLLLYNLLVEKLLSQYAMLSDYLSPHLKPTAVKQTRQQLKSIHQLPPRERLEKYYEALRLLNEKITALEDQNLKSHSSLLTQQLVYQQQRRTKCLQAIETLEEYLAFKQEQENLDELKNN